MAAAVPPLPLPRLDKAHLALHQALSLQTHRHRRRRSGGGGSSSPLLTGADAHPPDEKPSGGRESHYNPHSCLSRGRRLATRGLLPAHRCGRSAPADKGLFGRQAGAWGRHLLDGYYARHRRELCKVDVCRRLKGRDEVDRRSRIAAAPPRRRRGRGRGRQSSAAAKAAALDGALGQLHRHQAHLDEAGRGCGHVLLDGCEHRLGKRSSRRAGLLGRQLQRHQPRRRLIQSQTKIQGQQVSRAHAVLHRR